MASTVFAPSRSADDTKLFLWLAIAMASVIVFGFSLQLAMGRSTFAVPVYVHLHALIFFGWTTLFVLQTALISSGNRALHRRLGWVGAGWAAAVVLMGTLTTILSVRAGRTPFFFTPAYFIVMNPASALTFGGLTAAAILRRRDTGWHRRLLVCGMAELTGPGFGRFLPLPFVIPFAGWLVFAAILLFPIAGAIADRRRHGRVHPAWLVGMSVMAATQIVVTLVAASPLGGAIYRAATAGSPVANADPNSYPPPPWAVHR